MPLAITGLRRRFAAAVAFALIFSFAILRHFHTPTLPYASDGFDAAAGFKTLPPLIFSTLLIRHITSYFHEP